MFKGARWDINTGVIVESKLKELHPTMPIIYIKAVSQEINVKYLRNFRKYFWFFKDKQELKTLYECPIYKTRQRGEIIRISFFMKTLLQVQPTYGHSTSKQKQNPLNGFLQEWLYFCKFKSQKNIILHIIINHNHQLLEL